jgi:hypothetical protein
LWRVPLYILPGFPSPTNSHGFWAAPPSPALADDEEDDAEAAAPFAAMLPELERAKGMRGNLRREDADAGTPGRSRIAAVVGSPIKPGSGCRV